MQISNSNYANNFATSGPVEFSKIKKHFPADRPPGPIDKSNPADRTQDGVSLSGESEGGEGGTKVQSLIDSLMSQFGDIQEMLDASAKSNQGTGGALGGGFASLQGALEKVENAKSGKEKKRALNKLERVWKRTQRKVTKKEGGALVPRDLAERVHRALNPNSQFLGGSAIEGGYTGPSPGQRG